MRVVDVQLLHFSYEVITVYLPLWSRPSQRTAGHLCPPGESVQTAGGRCLPSRGQPARVRLLANKHRGRSARKARQTNSNWTHGDKKHPLTPTSLNKCYF